MITLRITAALSILFSMQAAAQSPEEFAIAGKLAYRAFECTHLASAQSDETEKMRLFQIGLQQARKAAEAYKNGLVTQDELSKKEILIAFFFDGPSPDFIAGQMYEGAGNNVWLQIRSEIGSTAPLSESRRVTKQIYDQKNCEFVTAGR